MKRFDFEEERVIEEIAKRDAKKVLIQLPEGLKPEAPRLAKMIEKCGALAIVSADPCYGACDLATTAAETLDIDLVVHYGHARLITCKRAPIIYVETRATLSVYNAVCKALPLIKDWRKIGLTTTIQHIQTLGKVKELLVQAGKTVVVGDSGKMNYPGQVIGCDYSNVRSIAKDVDAFLFVGGGQFHALGVALSSSKPTIVADPYGNLAYGIEKEAAKILKQRWACVKEAQRAKHFGVLIGLKPGQKRFGDAVVMKEKLEKNGRSAVLFAVTEVTPDVLLEFPSIDAYVNTTCPRLSLDDVSRFKKPMLSFNEGLVVAGELSWEELCKRGLLEN